jgi:hypothetical protein
VDWGGKWRAAETLRAAASARPEDNGCKRPGTARSQAPAWERTVLPALPAGCEAEARGQGGYEAEPRNRAQRDWTIRPAGLYYFPFTV